MQQTIQNSFKALADPTRRTILMHLSHQEMTVQELTDNFDMTRAAVKKHLNILEKGKLISAHRCGRDRINRLETKGLESVTEWLNYFDQFWDQRLDALSHAIESSKNKTQNKHLEKGMNNV
ncbi:MAG: metalloregulator ArsR/SmtB family transcription factor [Cocleimonas sp.]